MIYTLNKTYSNLLTAPSVDQTTSGTLCVQNNAHHLQTTTVKATSEGELGCVGTRFTPYITDLTGGLLNVRVSNGQYQVYNYIGDGTLRSLPFFFGDGDVSITASTVGFPRRTYVYIRFRTPVASILNVEAFMTVNGGGVYNENPTANITAGTVQMVSIYEADDSDILPDRTFFGFYNIMAEAQAIWTDG